MKRILIICLICLLGLTACDKNGVKTNGNEVVINEEINVEKIDNSHFIAKKAEFINKVENINFYLESAFSEYDKLLNEIYAYLRENMSNSEFKKLKKDEIKWIKLKEKAIARSDDKLIAAKYTKERCYYLISLLNDMKYDDTSRLISGEMLNSKIINSDKIIFDNYKSNNYGFKWGKGEDVSVHQDNSIQLFKKDKDTYILSKETIFFNADSGGMFKMNVYPYAGATFVFNNIDTSNVIDISDMFMNCVFSEIDIRCFDTSNVTNMRGMFSNCENLNNIDLSNFNTSNVVNMSEMFSDCRSLRSLNLSNFDTKNVNDMFCMFESCTNLSELDISTFDLDKVNDTTDMFLYCRELKIDGIETEYNEESLQKATQKLNLSVSDDDIKKLDEVCKIIAANIKIDEWFDVANHFMVVDRYLKYDELRKYYNKAYKCAKSGQWWFESGFSNRHDSMIVDFDNDGLEDILMGEYGSSGNGSLFLLKGTSNNGDFVLANSYEGNFGNHNVINYGGLNFEYNAHSWADMTRSYDVYLWKNGKQAIGRTIGFKINDYEIINEYVPEEQYSEIINKGIKLLGKDGVGVGIDVGTAEEVVSKNEFKTDINNDGMIEEYTKDLFYSSSYYNFDHVTYEFISETDYIKDIYDDRATKRFWVDKDSAGENVICFITGSNYENVFVGYKLKGEEIKEVFKVNKKPLYTTRISNNVHLNYVDTGNY